MLDLPKQFVLHSLRHTFGTRLGEAGTDAFTIMRIMGHSTITVSQRYVHPAPETLGNAFLALEVAAKTAESKRQAENLPDVTTIFTTLREAAEGRVQ